MNQYPDINVCLKLHLVHRHLYELPEKYGFLGRGNEQGSESCHVRVNKIASICRASKGADQFALAMQKKLRMGDLSQVGCIENDFISGRTKIVNRKKNCTVKLESKKTQIFPEKCKVQDRSTVEYEGKEYCRLEMVKCSCCNKTFPTEFTILHFISTHSIINIDIIEDFKRLSLEESKIIFTSAVQTISTSSVGVTSEKVNGAKRADAETTITRSSGKPEQENSGHQDSDKPFSQVKLVGGSNDNTNARREPYLMAPLSDEEDKLVWQALHGDGQNSDIIAMAGSESVQRESIQRLRQGIWLNDELVNCYFTLIKQRDAIICQNSPGKLHSRFFNSFFFSNLLENGSNYNYENVKTWSKSFDIFASDKIFVPINIKNKHWSLIVAYMQQQKIQYYDSLGHDGRKLLEAFLRYIEDEHLDKKQVLLPDKKSWKLIPCKNDCPKQENDVDCGVFCCAFADFLSRDLELLFGQGYVTDYRRKLALSIIKAHL